MVTREKPKIFLTRRWPAEVEAELATRYAVTINERDQPLGVEILRAAMADHDALCPTVSDRIGLDILEAQPRRAQLVASYGVGTDHIDLAAARKLGVTVTNTPGILTDATAEIAVLLMLMIARRAGEGEREVRAGQWEGWRPTHLVGRQLAGATLGLIGFGRIAQATAEKARALWNVRVLYHSRRRVDTDVERRFEATYCSTPEELVGLSDVVSLHCPGTAETRHLMDERLLGSMKPGSFLINTSRGTVVDEAALELALRAGAIGGAGLDVYEAEPRVRPGLMALNNVVLLPHLGSATAETRIAMGRRVASNLDSFFAGQDPADRVV